MIIINLDEAYEKAVEGASASQIEGIDFLYEQAMPKLATSKQQDYITTLLTKNSTDLETELVELDPALSGTVLTSITTTTASKLIRRLRAK